MGDATEPGCAKMGGLDTGACVNNAETMHDNGLWRAKNKVNIVARNNQIDANSKIYYKIYLSDNRYSTTLKKTNKTFILISF